MLPKIIGQFFCIVGSGILFPGHVWSSKIQLPPWHVGQSFRLCTLVHRVLSLVCPSSSLFLFILSELCSSFQIVCLSLMSSVLSGRHTTKFTRSVKMMCRVSPWSITLVISCSSRTVHVPGTRCISFFNVCFAMVLDTFSVSVERGRWVPKSSSTIVSSGFHWKFLSYFLLYNCFNAVSCRLAVCLITDTWWSSMHFRFWGRPFRTHLSGLLSICLLLQREADFAQEIVWTGSYQSCSASATCTRRIVVM